MSRAIQRLRRAKRGQKGPWKRSLVRPAKIGPGDLLLLFLRGKTPNTIATYKRDLKAFALHMETTVPEAIGVLLKCSRFEANVLATEWQGMMAEGGLSANTQVRRISTLRCLTRRACNSGLIDWVLDVETPKAKAFRDTSGPTLEKLQQLLAACGDDREGRRNRFILLALSSLGLRRAELVDLQFKYYDKQGYRFHVLGKGGEWEWMTLKANLKAAWLEWLEVTPVDQSDDEAPVICSLSSRKFGAKLTKQGLNHIITTIGERAGMKLNPHALRHYTGTRALDLGHSLRSVQRLMRHKNPQTTMIYDDNRRDLGAVPSADIDSELGKEEEK